MLKSFFFCRFKKNLTQGFWCRVFLTSLINSIDYDSLIFKKLKKIVILIMIFLFEKKVITGL